MQHFYVFSCTVGANSVSLQRVFHGIRFKVNKGWGAAAPLFFALNFRSYSYKEVFGSLVNHYIAD